MNTRPQDFDTGFRVIFKGMYCVALFDPEHPYRSPCSEKVLSSREQSPVTASQVAQHLIKSLSCHRQSTSHQQYTIS